MTPSHPRSPGDRGRRWVRPSPAYDLVITRMTMHHVADLEHLMTSVRTMLRSGGAYLAIDLTDRSADFDDHPTPPVPISYSQGKGGQVQLASGSATTVDILTTSRSEVPSPAQTPSKRETKLNYTMKRNSAGFRAELT